MLEYVESPPPLNPLIRCLSLYFQIRDDLVNLASTNYQSTKGFCEDLTEGKFSHPVVHCINHTRSGNIIKNVLSRKTADREILSYAVGVLKKSGSLKYTHDRCLHLKEEVLVELGKLGGNEGVETIVTMLHKEVEKIGKAL